MIREASKTDETLGRINVERSKKAAHKMINGEAGRLINRRQRQEKENNPVRSLFDEVENVDITVNLLTKSGLAQNQAERDVNILEDSINEACRCLKEDELDAILDRHFGLDQLNDKKRKQQADGCTIASLLLMNAAMLHQRIASGSWLQKISGMDSIKNQPDVIDEIHSQWNRITRHDFLPVIEPAIEVIESVRKYGRREGLNRALRHLACEAERIAEDYANLGADHAGPLFNKVMGNQASDGAFFTRPPSASLLARLTLDISSGDADWNLERTWKEHRSVDLACGSGTLIAALLTEMKRRVEKSGADQRRIAEFQKLAVEKLIAGLDFNPVSLQLAASQMTSGNSDIAYRKMQLHCMLYGEEDGQNKAGSLELLSQSSILPRKDQIAFEDEALGSEQMQLSSDHPTLEDAVQAVKRTRIVIMNPPFTNRAKMGEKFRVQVQTGLRNKVDELEEWLVEADPEMKGFVDKNSIRPLFVALADKCLDEKTGILSAIHPTIALTGTSGQQERKILASRFHIHTLLTCHQPRQVNLSQNTMIHESMIVAQRHKGASQPTRIISLDRMPLNDQEVGELHNHLIENEVGTLPNGWGEVSEWQAEQIEIGDWSAVAFRSPKLAEAAVQIVNDNNLLKLCDHKVMPADTGRLLRGSFQLSSISDPSSIPILKSKSSEGQLRINGEPDEYWAPKVESRSGDEESRMGNQKTANILKNAGYLLVTAGQNTNSSRLTAVACEKTYVGNSWLPVAGLNHTQAKAVSVFLNSTAGRLQFMRTPGRTLMFPVYSAKEIAKLRIPDLADKQICQILATCWNETQHMKVPQYRDGECEVRRLWDEAVAKAVGWNPEKLAEWRQLLHMEPHVRGLGHNQYSEEIEIE